MKNELRQELAQDVQAFLENGGQIVKCRPQKAKKSLSLSRAIGHKESAYNVGRQRKIARDIANRLAR